MTTDTLKTLALMALFLLVAALILYALWGLYVALGGPEDYSINLKAPKGAYVTVSGEERGK